MKLSQEVRIWILLIALFITIAVIDIRVEEESYQWITCGEALHRATGSAAPRDNREYSMYNECLFQNIKRWD